MRIHNSLNNNHIQVQVTIDSVDKSLFGGVTLTLEDQMVLGDFEKKFLELEGKIDPSLEMDVAIELFNELSNKLSRRGKNLFMINMINYIKINKELEESKKMKIIKHLKKLIG